MVPNQIADFVSAQRGGKRGLLRVLAVLITMLAVFVANPSSAQASGKTGKPAPKASTSQKLKKKQRAFVRKLLNNKRTRNITKKALRARRSLRKTGRKLVRSSSRWAGISLYRSHGLSKSDATTMVGLVDRLPLNVRRMISQRVHHEETRLQFQKLNLSGGEGGPVTQVYELHAGNRGVLSLFGFGGGLDGMVVSTNIDGRPADVGFTFRDTATGRLELDSTVDIKFKDGGKQRARFSYSIDEAGTFKLNAQQHLLDLSR